MQLVLYNTLHKKKEVFSPLNEKNIKVYTCGPTVYSYAHIGNMSAYLMADILIRVLENILGYTVTFVKNITDVGHLVSDGDDGEDKLDREAKKQKKDPLEIANFYIKHYMEDEKMLRMREPDYRPRATDFIDQMKKTVEDLVEKGFAYETKDGVYMDICKIPDYGKLSGNTLSELNAGARIEINTEKKHPADFALWKKAPENHIMKWDSPWGPSFPGWHIECSCMAWEFFHGTYDIKTGGEDNIFPHHECEIAQTFAAYNVPLAKYFLHKRHIQLEGMKMAKSQGNVVNLKDLREEGFTPEAVRLSLIKAHYRTRLNFTRASLQESQKIIDKANTVISSLLHSVDALFTEKSLDEKFSHFQKDFEKALLDDLNTPQALEVMCCFIRFCNTHQETFSESEKKQALFLWKFFDSVFQVFDFEKKNAEEDIPATIKTLLEKRNEARENKDYKKADEYRDEIQKQGYAVIDGKEGAKVVKN